MQEGDQFYAAFALNNLARVQRRLDQLDDALDSARRAVDVWREAYEVCRAQQHPAAEEELERLLAGAGG
jgi:hypothetical protein